MVMFSSMLILMIFKLENKRKTNPECKNKANGLLCFLYFVFSPFFFFLICFCVFGFDWFAFCGFHLLLHVSCFLFKLVDSWNKQCSGECTCLIEQRLHIFWTENNTSSESNTACLEEGPICCRDNASFRGFQN